MSTVATVPGTIAVRVTVHDVWDELHLIVPAELAVGDLKKMALAQAHVVRDAALYEIKFRGASLADESLSLAKAGVVDNAALIVLSRRRRPVH